MNGFQYKYGDRPLEGYTIQRAIGRGGFGEVYFALSDSGREVALKAIQGYEQIELRGVSQCMNLKSPHLVTVFDVRHNDEGKPFVIMEYVAGPSLKDLLDQSPSGLGVQKAAFFLREIAKGLTFLHDRGIVHRDLKPGNVFYEDGYVKIGDYGLSKAMTASRYSGQTITVGTVHYMAPEIGQGRYDCGVDIYALGCCLYEMLTGNVPFFGSSHGEILMKHLMAEPDLTGIEEPFAGAIRKALAKDPADRFKSAQEMVEAIYGAEHVRNSVSCFSPDSLTVVAGRVAQRVAVGGPGSSADAVRLGPPPPVGAPAARAGGALTDRAGGALTDRAAGAPAGGSSDPWVELANRMDEIGQRVGQLHEHVGNRMRQVRDRLSGRMPARLTPGDAPLQDGGEILDSNVIAFADPKRDPLRSRHRRMLALITIGATGVGGAFVGARDLRSVGIAWLMATLVTLGGVWGISIAYRYFRPRLRNETGFLPRLAFGGMACLVALPFALVCMAACDGGAYGGRVQERALMTLATIAIGLLLLDWHKRTSPGREERVSLGAAFMAGLAAWIGSLFLHGSGLLAAAVMAGTSLAIQVATPFDPQAIRRPNRRKKKSQWHGVNLASEVPGGASPAAPYVEPEADGRLPSPAGTAGQPGRMPYAPSVSQRKFYLTPPWLRAIFLALFAILAGTGLMLVIWGGMADTSPIHGLHGPRYGSAYVNGEYIYRTHPGEAAMAIAFGCGCLLLSLFSLFRAVKRTYGGVWSAFIRPVLMLLCVQAILASSVVMGSVSRLRDDDLMIGLAFVIFPAMLLLVLLFIGDGTIRSLFSGIQAGPTISAYQPWEVSGRKRLWALLLALLGVVIPMPIAGLHRFYVGKFGTGILWLLTFGLFGLGTIVDVVLIVCGRFRDAQYRRLLIWHGSEVAPAFPATVPAGGTPPPVGFVPQVQAPGAVSPGAEQQPAGAAPSPGPSSVWIPSAYGPQLPPRQTSTFWSAVGMLLLVPAFVLGLAVIFVPSLVAAGFPDPGAAAELNRLFGYANWPGLVARLGTGTAVGLMLVGVTALVIGRRRAGAAHTGRAVLAVISLGMCLTLLNDSIRWVQWSDVTSLANTNRVGPAIERILDSVDSGPLMFSIVLLLGGMVLLSWPERRRQVEDVSRSTGGG